MGLVGRWAPARSAARLAPRMVCWTALATLLLFAGPVAAQRSLEIAHFDATIEVEKSGWVDVREEIEVRFQGSWNGIFRLIPVEYRTEQGFSYRLFLDDVTVTGPDGKPYEFWNSKKRHYREIKIRVPGARDATRKVVIHYRVPNALRFWDGYDELYWNVTGDEWEVPIRSVSAMIILPDGVEGGRTASWTGGYGSTEDAASVQKTEDGFYLQTREGLNFREGLTVAVAWNPGVVARPTLLTKVLRFLKANWLLLLPLGSLAIMRYLWSTRGRDPTRLPISPQYEPPDDLTPAEAGTLLDNSPDMRDITAGLVDLAVRGFLRIEEIEPSGMIGKLVGKDDYRLVGVKPRETWLELRAHERQLLEGIFGAGAGDPGSVKLSSLEHEFYRSLPGIKAGIFAELIGRAYYSRRPDKVLGLYLSIGAIVLVGGISGAIPLAEALQMSQLTAILAAVLTAVPIFVFGFFMPARTVKGTRVLERVLGFEEFLDRVDAERYRRMITSPEMFEKFLPYAMAFGVEKKWASAFDDLYTEPPDWYRGRWDGGFRATYFVNNMGSMSTVASSSLGSGPRSSGGSGFSGGGGGFSGGGFGGGGGGGW